MRWKENNCVELINYLIKTFGYNEPILLEEISFKGFSKPWINKQLAKYIDNGELIRFDKGVYYVPKKTMLGFSKLNPQKVIEKKYISNKDGYYSGVSFLNRLGLSEQIPNLIEVYTNNESSKVREVDVGAIKVLLRKARTEINESNVAVQSFLELMNYVSSSFFNDKRKKIIVKYINDNGITRDDIVKYAGFFPDKAMRTLVESQVIYDVTQ